MAKKKFNPKYTSGSSNVGKRKALMSEISNIYKKHRGTKAKEKEKRIPTRCGSSPQEPHGTKRQNMKVKKNYKGGGKFPDLNKDGKVTKADILKGRGVFKKKGGKKRRHVRPERCTERSVSSGTCCLHEFW